MPSCSACCSRARVGPDEIRIGTDPAVYYQVVGWDADAKALIVARIDE